MTKQLAISVLAATLAWSAAEARAQVVELGPNGFAIPVELPDATFQCDATPELETSAGLQLQSGIQGPFVVGTHEPGDYPGRMRTGDDFDPATPDLEVLESCASVTVEYSLGGEGEPLACAETEILYEREGVEVDAVSLDGDFLGNASFAEGTVGSAVLSAEGIQGPGTHSLNIAATLRNGGDGFYEPRSLELVCTPLVAFAQIGGGLQEPDVPAGGRGNKRGLKAPTHVVSGEIGVAEADGSALGELRVLYRDALGDRPVSCHFSPGAAGTTGIAMGVATLLGWEYVCNDGDPAAMIEPTSGVADAVIAGRDGSGSAPKKGHNKHRGSLCVAADDAALSLGDCAVEDGLLDLDRGNARVVGDTAPMEPEPMDAAL